MKRRAIWAALAVVLAVVCVAGWQVAVGWIFGVPPRDQYLRLIHDDVPPLWVPAHLREGVPVTFQARIIRKRKYEMNLLVYFGSKEERAAVEGLIERPVGRPNSMAEPSSRLPTIVRITVQNQERRVQYDQSIRSDGVLMTAAHYLGRHPDLFALEEGIYAISVTPLNDVSPLDSFQIELELEFSTRMNIPVASRIMNNADNYH